MASTEVTAEAEPVFATPADPPGGVSTENPSPLAPERRLAEETEAAELGPVTFMDRQTFLRVSDDRRRLPCFALTSF